MAEIKDLFDIDDEPCKKAKSEEEINKMCTAEGLTELQRATYLLKKGYEIQKLSVVNNLHRYSKELGANEELISLIINSLEDWDNKMQIECAQSFIAPLKAKSLSQNNNQRLLKLSIQLVTNEHLESQVLQDSWIQVFDNVVGQVDFPYIKLVAVKVIGELTDRKSKQNRRKLGNRLLSSLILNCGESTLEKDSEIFSLITDVCSDTNYKIRTDGAIFFKQFIQQNHERVVGTKRMEEKYLPEIIYLLNDDDYFIKIECLEALHYVMDSLPMATIENEIVPSFLKLLNHENQHDEVMERMSKILGPVCYKLQREDLHLKHQQQILEFYRASCLHKKDECRLNSAFNLPCMNQIYRKHLDKIPPMLLHTQSIKLLSSPPTMISCSSTSLSQYNEIEESKDDTLSEQQGPPFTFDNVYLVFMNDGDDRIRQSIACSIHEGFITAGEEEDTTALRDTFHELMTDEQPEVLISLVPNMDQTIEKYCNQYAIANFNPSEIQRVDPPSPRPGQQLPQLPVKGSANEKSVSKGNQRAQLKRAATTINDDKALSDDATAQYIYLQEYTYEHFYSFLLNRLICFNHKLRSKIAYWREYVQFLDKLQTKIYKFHIPEFQDKFCCYIFDDLKKGNTQLRKMCCRLLVKILINQQDRQRRETLQNQILTEMGDSKSFQLRRCYIWFCRECVGQMSRTLFEDIFYKTYHKLANDKVDAVRYEFALSLLDIKPYIDSKTEINTQLIQHISNLKNDSNREVSEATENIDFELLKSRKKVIASLQQQEEKCILKLKKLEERESLENEERRKRQEDDDTFEYYGYGASKNGGFKTGAPKRGVRTGTQSSSNTVNKGAGRKISTGQVGDSNSNKKKKPLSQTSKTASIQEDKTAQINDANAKKRQSVVLPHQSQSTNNVLDRPAATFKPEVKRSNSLLNPSQQKPNQSAVKKEPSFGSQAKKQQQKQQYRMSSSSDSDSDVDITPTNLRQQRQGANSSTTNNMSFGGKAKQQ